jgi:hypothetical protein
LLVVFLPCVLFAFPGTIAAADPPIDMLPPPRPVPTAPVYVWQNYAVDRSGRFAPLVVDSPNGFVYRYNGAPAPWVTVNPRSYQRIYVGQ